jgi:hypothetical protein
MTLTRPEEGWPDPAAAAQLVERGIGRRAVVRAALAADRVTEGQRGPSLPLRADGWSPPSG